MLALLIIYVDSVRKGLGFKKQCAALSQLSNVIEGEIGLYRSFNRYFLNTCYLPGTILRAENIEANKPDIFAIMKSTF